MRRTKEDAKKTRKDILDAALEIFHLRGVTSAGLSEIAEKANVTRGAVYWHFKDKQDLYFALYDSLIKEFQFGAEDFNSHYFDTLDEFLKEVQRPLKLLENNKRFQMFISIIYSRTEYVEALKPIITNEQDKQRSLVNAYIRCLDDLQKRGLVNPSIDSSQFSYILYSFVNGSYDAWSFDTDIFPDNCKPYNLLLEIFKTLRA